MNGNTRETGQSRGWLDSQLESVEVQLSAPIMVGDQEVMVLRIREPIARDLKMTDGIKGEMAVAEAMLARCCDVPPSSIGMLRLRDYQRCMEEFQKLGFSAPDEQDEELESAAALPDGSAVSAE